MHDCCMIVCFQFDLHEHCLFLFYMMSEFELYVKDDVILKKRILWHNYIFIIFISQECKHYITLK